MPVVKRAKVKRDHFPWRILAVVISFSGGDERKRRQ
jgi:hypothetical protein